MNSKSGTTSFINESIFRFDDILRSKLRDERDKKLCVESFAAYLREHAFSLDETIPADVVCARASKRYTDDTLKKICKMDIFPEKQYEESIRLCLLQEENNKILVSAQPMLSDETTGDIEFYRSQIVEKRRLGKLYEDALDYGNQIDLDIEKLGKDGGLSFEEVIKHIDIYRDMLNELSQKKIDTYLCKNRDVDALKQRIETDQKFFITSHEEMLNLSDTISRLDETRKKDESGVNELLQLLEKLDEIRNRRKIRGWDNPKLSCGEPRFLLKKYKLYSDMLKLDKIIDLKRRKHFDVNDLSLDELCRQQIYNINQCKQFQWNVPILSVEFPGQVMSYLQFEREVRKDLSKDIVAKDEHLSQIIQRVDRLSDKEYNELFLEIAEFEKALNKCKKHYVDISHLKHQDVNRLRNEVASSKQKAIGYRAIWQDKNLSSILANVNKLTSDAFPELFSLIDQYEQTLYKCKEYNIDYSRLKNKDTIELRNKVLAARQNNEKRKKRKKKITCAIVIIGLVFLGIVISQLL